MIKINLIGDEEQISFNSILLIIGFFSSLLLTIIGWLVTQWLVSSYLDDVKDRVQSTEIQLATLKTRTKEVDGLKQTKDELQNITLAIAVLKRTQQGPVRLLDDINTATPERIWVTSIDSKVDKMKIAAIALEDSDISTFIQDLRKSGLIIESDLTDRRSVPLLQVNTFNSFSGEQTRRVVRGDRTEASAVFSDIRAEATDLGLNYSNSLPESSLKDSVATIGDPASGAVTKLSFADIKKSARTKGGRPTIYAWESLEKVKGLGFTVDLKIRYDDSGVDIEALSNAIVFKEPESDSKSKKGAKKK